MKKLIFLMITFFICQPSVFPQIGCSCLPEGIMFTTQEQIDSFRINYPGCIEIEGDLIVSDYCTGSINNLNGLSGLTSIGGDLWIYWTDVLNNLDGLQGVNTIGGSLLIGYYGGGMGGTLGLINLSGLDKVNSVGGDLIIEDNWDLKSLTGLGSLINIGGDLCIIGSDSLSGISELSNLTSIGGDLSIYENNSLSSLTGLEGLTEVPGSLILGTSGDLGMCIGNPMLTSLTGLDNLNVIGGDLIIFGSSLTDMTGLENLESIGGFLGVICNYSLINLNGMQNLATTGGIIIGDYSWASQAGNPVLNSLSALENLTTIGEDLIIQFNESLTNLSGLENVNSIGGGLIISENNQLCDCNIQSISNYLASPNGTVEIHHNAPGCNGTGEIADAAGITLPCLPYGNYHFSSQHELDLFPTVFPGCFDLHGDVIIGGNDITNLSALINVSSIEGELSIGHDSGVNPVLASLSGLDNLSSIGGQLFIYHNSVLTSLTELQNLSSIGGQIYCSYNNALTSLSGLDNIDPLTIPRLWIKDNSQLSVCEVQSVCDYLAMPDIDIWITENAPGCDNEEEVMNACDGVVIPEVTGSQSSIVSFPNPTDGIAHFALRISQYQYVTLKVYDAQGREIAVLVDENLPEGEHTLSFDLPGLPAGLYFYQLTANGQRLTAGGKIIKY